MKDNYFSHDFGARNDPKLIEVQMDLGGVGLGIYWCLVEMLWEQEGFLPRNYRALAFCLRWAEEEDIRRVVEDYGLFGHDEEKFWSESLLNRKALRDAGSEAKKAAGLKGANKRYGKAELQQSHSTPIAELQQSHSTPIAIKENKEKKIKDSSSCAPAGAREGEEEKEEQKELIFMMFFFMNFMNPAYELGRFWNYYQGRGWKWGDQQIADIGAVAQQWTPESTGRRFATKVLDYLKEVAGAASLEEREWTPAQLLMNVVEAHVLKAGGEIEITMATRAWAAHMNEVIRGAKELRQDIKLKFRS